LGGQFQYFRREIDHCDEEVGSKRFRAYLIATCGEYDLEDGIDILVRKHDERDTGT